MPCAGPHNPILPSTALRSRRTLLPDAQYCYSRAIMKTVLLAVLAASLAMGACFTLQAAEGPGLADAPQSPREIYHGLNALRVDNAQIYAVNEIRLRRDAVSLIFSEGMLGFLRSAPQSPREIYHGLNALRVDNAQIYAVNEIRLRRDAVSLIFSEGMLGFLQAYGG